MWMMSDACLHHTTLSTSWNGVKSWPSQNRCCEQPVRSQCRYSIATECSRGESTASCWQPEAANLSRVVSAMYSRDKCTPVGRRSSHLRSSRTHSRNFTDATSRNFSQLNHTRHTALVVSGCNHPHKRRTALATDVPVELEQFSDEQDYLKAGGGDLRLVQLQAFKPMDQPKIADKVSFSV